jgi:photosystem II stability/assembly factor-like uncharacterized protein
MKHLFALLFLLGSIPASAQWIAQTSGTTNDLNDVYFADTHHGWAVGGFGVIRYTNNGGTTWSSQTSNTTYTLNAVWFANAQEGWAVGDNGNVTHTSNGGVTWALQTTNTVNKLRAVYFINQDTGFCAGQGGMMLRTFNGGNTWSQIGTALAEDIYALHFNGSTGYLCGRNANFQKTTNLGTNWTYMAPPNNLDTLKGVFFTSASTGYVVSHTGLVLGTDGNGNWTTSQPGTPKSLNAVWFTNPSNGWVVGDSGRIYMTNNAGISWNMQTANTTQKINGVHFPNDSAGWCVANFGAIRKLALITVDVNESEENPFALRAFPNPSNDQNINLSFTLQNNEDVCVEIFDATGRQVQSIKYPFNAGRKGLNQTISNITLPESGIYIVRITQGDFVSQVRLIRN